METDDSSSHVSGLTPSMSVSSLCTPQRDRHGNRVQSASSMQVMTDGGRKGRRGRRSFGEGVCGPNSASEGASPALKSKFNRKKSKAWNFIRKVLLLQRQFSEKGPKKGSLLVNVFVSCASNSLVFFIVCGMSGPSVSNVVLCELTKRQVIFGLFLYSRSSGNHASLCVFYLPSVLRVVNKPRLKFASLLPHPAVIFWTVCASRPLQKDDLNVAYQFLRRGYFAKRSRLLHLDESLICAVVWSEVLSQHEFVLFCFDFHTKPIFLCRVALILKSRASFCFACAPCALPSALHPRPGVCVSLAKNAVRRRGWRHTAAAALPLQPEAVGQHDDARASTDQGRLGRLPRNSDTPHEAKEDQPDQSGDSGVWTKRIVQAAPQTWNRFVISIFAHGRGGEGYIIAKRSSLWQAGYVSWK